MTVPLYVATPKGKETVGGRVELDGEHITEPDIVAYGDPCAPAVERLYGDLFGVLGLLNENWVERQIRVHRLHGLLHDLGDLLGLPFDDALPQAATPSARPPAVSCSAGWGWVKATFWIFPSAP